MNIYLCKIISYSTIGIGKITEVKKVVSTHGNTECIERGNTTEKHNGSPRFPK